MRKNLGTMDRLVRLALAIMVGVGFFMVDSMIIKGVLALSALFILYEALAGWCALYALIGKNTCPISYE